MKMKDIIRDGGRYSFNRYIVECKFVPYVFIGTSDAGFNRYIVECKFRYAS